LKRKVKRFSKKIVASLSLLVAVFLFAAGCSQGSGAGNHEGHSGADNPGAGQNRLTLQTKNVTRVGQDDPVKAAIETAQIIWPATSIENRPGTVLLGIKGNWRINMAAVTLIHHPNNGPLLYAEKERIPDETLKEIKRLNPLGSKANNGVQVILVGDFSDRVRSQLEREGWKVDAVSGKDPAEMAGKLDAYYADVSGELPQGVVVGAVDAPEYTLPAANWIAHMPEPLLYVTRNGVPEATVEALKKRKGKANIYLLGPETAVSGTVERELEKYGKVVRISGKTPEENAIAFAKYKDPKTHFGWGITEPGHGFVFSRLSNVDSAIAGAPFSHLGKHAPLLLMESSRLSPALHEYLMSVQPTFEEDPTVGPFNHAFLIGSEKSIPFSTQGTIDQMLEISPRTGHGHNAH